MSLVQRPVDVVVLPSAGAVVALRTERLILRFDRDTACDIGARCYASRAPARTSAQRALLRAKSEQYVDLASLSQRRVVGIRAVVEYLMRLHADGGQRPTTVFSIARFFCAFLDWCDSNGHKFVLESPTVAREVFASYLEHLRDRVARSDLANNTAAITQNYLLNLLVDVVGDERLGHGLNLLRVQKSSTNATVPPSEESQARVLALVGCLFDGLTELVLDRRPYPYALAVPQSLGALDDTLWVFPTSRWCMPPHELRSRDSMKYGGWAYDYSRGRVSEVADIRDRYIVDPTKNTKDKVAEVAIAAAEARIRTANADFNHRTRRQAAVHAHNAFLTMFLAHTGVNWATAQQLRWGDDPMEIGIERQGFRTIKHRAMGRGVSFEIQPIFVKTFQQYVVLRAYLLDGRPYEYLFMVPDARIENFEPLRAKSLTYVMKTLQRIDPAMASIMSKRWRAGKSDWLLRNVDVSTAALILQNSEQTVIRAYAEGSPTVQADEMGSFLTKLADVVVPATAVIKNGSDTAVGQCASYGSPVQSVPGPIAPDCRGTEGCLFCDKYRVHADERDTRKLVSCRYCLEQAARLASSEEQALTLYAPIFARISDLLNEIATRNAALVARIEVEVTLGELEPYWASKLELLVAIGLVE